MKSTVIKLGLLILMLFIGVAAQKTKTNQSPSQTNSVFHNLYNEAVPLFVFTYISPWRNVYGSDSPEFVLYEDGTVIFTKCKEQDNPYSCYFHKAKLSSEAISQILEKLHSKSFYTFDEHYSPDSNRITVSDLTYRLFVMRKPDGTYKKVSTYGALDGDKEGYVAKNVPSVLKEIVEFVNSYDNANSTNLNPEYFEVVLEPYNDDSKKNLKWSKHLPDLNDSKTIKHKKYDRYSLFVHNSLSRKVREITFKQWKSEAAILINNQRWEAEMRIPFPAETIWLGNFRD